MKWGRAVNRGWRRTLIPVAILAAMSAFVVGPAAANPVPDQHRSQLAIATVSNPRPELVSGGEALVRVTGAAAGHVRITENGHDITPAFHAQSDNSLLGLVTGLHEGANC